MIFYFVLFLFLLSLIVDGYLFSSRVNIYHKILIFFFLIAAIVFKIGFEAFNEPAILSKDKDISSNLTTKEFFNSYQKEPDKYVNNNKKLGANRIEIYSIIESLVYNGVKLDNNIVCMFMPGDYLKIENRLGIDFLNKKITIHGDDDGMNIFDEIVLVNCVLIDY